MIYEKSKEEQLEGILSPWPSAEELDDLFGVANWFGILDSQYMQYAKFIQVVLRPGGARLRVGPWRRLPRGALRADAFSGGPPWRCFVLVSEPLCI